MPDGSVSDTFAFLAGALASPVSLSLHHKTKKLDINLPGKPIFKKNKISQGFISRHLIWGPHNADKLAQRQMENSTYQSTLSQAEMEVFRAPSPPAPNRRARICCCHTSTSCQSAHAHGRVEGERLANSPQHTITSRESHQKYSTSHRYIRLVVRRAKGSAASSIRGDQCHTEGEEGEAGGACWLTEMIPGFSIGRFSQSEIYWAVAELWMSLKLQIHRLNKTKCT